MRHVVAALLALPLALAANPSAGPPADAGAPPPPAPPPPALRYRITASLDDAAKQVRGEVRVDLRNRSSRPLERARLHLYLNAFADAHTLFMRGSHGGLRHSRADPDQPGWIRGLRVTQDGRPAHHHRLEDGTVMEVRLPRPVPPGDELRLELRFVSRLPRVFARTGHAGEFFMVAQWYPKLGVLRADGSWHCPPHHHQSEFFADFATYEVRLDLPRRMLVGATGACTRRERDGERQELTCRAERVHDFAFAAWPHFTAVSERRGRTLLRYLSVPGRGQADRQLALVRASLERLERWLIPYPYPTLTVVDVPTNALGASAMEYPQLFTTWMPWWAPAGLHGFDEITVHELVHQYFQGLVANNEAEEPWLDEGVTSYVAGMILDDLFGADRSFLDLGPLRLGNEQKERLRHAAPGPTLPVGWPARRFPSWREYGRMVYARGALLLRTVESLLGRAAMRRALRAYVRAQAFRHPTSADLERALLAQAPAAVRGSVEELLEAVLRGGQRAAYATRCTAGGVEVIRQGEVRLPLEVRLRRADGSERLVRWDGEGPRLRLAERDLAGAELGPPGRLALDPFPLDDRCQVAARRVDAAWTWAALVQLLLQLVGP